MAECIEREAAIAYIRDRAEERQRAFDEFGAESNGIYADAYNDLAEDFYKIPSIDVVPVRNGRWIALTDCSNAGVYCSVCHKKVYKADYARCNRKNKAKSPYCPNCGAKMDGGEYNA